MTPTRCPVCRKPALPDHAPFCSAGCRNRDLLQWLGEGYRLPGGTAAGTADAGEPDEADA